MKSPTGRSLRRGEEVKRVIASYLQEGFFHARDLSSSLLVVGEVRMSPDLRVAKVYISDLNGKNFLPALEKEKSFIRRHVGASLYMKYVPELIFIRDGLQDQAEKIDRLIERTSKSSLSADL